MTEKEYTQYVRLLDVFVIGPAIVYAGSQISTNWLKIGLIIIGIGTIVYNGINYIRYEKVSVSNNADI